MAVTCRPARSGSGQVEQGAGDPARAAALDVGVVAAGEADGEVQEERRLERGGDDVAPVDDPVEGVELAGVLEGVEDEGDQAEDDRSGWTWGRSSGGTGRRGRCRDRPAR